MTLDQYIAEQQKLLDRALDHWVPAESAPPATIHQAMRYSLFAGGKRIRPLLAIAAAHAVSNAPAGIESCACALEMIHTYSLIHDDLPALDNDDLRRGQPTCHKKFGEAMAGLAGDALLTLAFETLSRAPLPPPDRVSVIAEIAAAAGTRDGMVGGQVADLEAGGKAVTPEMLEYIHCSKTAALIRACVVSGAMAGDAGDADVARLRRFGDLIGWAFQG